MKLSVLLFAILLFVPPTLKAQNLPKGFCYVADKAPEVSIELRYASNNNFLGRQVKGYQNAKAILSCAALKALSRANHSLLTKGLRIRLYDGYRPQKAVDDFVAWSKIMQDTIQKEAYYPNIPKSQLFAKGYIASRSGHSRGSTVDITLEDAKTGKTLDMGGQYDFFGTQSHINYSALTKSQKQNRNILSQAMQNAGFKPYSKEWWHYTLKNEPFPKQYFNFDLK